MSGNSQHPNWWSWLKRGSANTTFVVCAFLALLFIGGAVYWVQSQPEPRVSLLAGAKLQEHDLGRMQLAFGGAGLNDFEVRDGQIFVPQSQRDRFLKALNDHDGIPETSREMYEPDSLNPWATSQQVQESTLLRKKKMIRQLVLQLEFVADAVVDYDELVDAGWPPTTRRSAAIVVRPKSDRLLESHQVDAIRNTICGAVAGLTPTDIVITDIAAGHAYVANDGASTVSSPGALDWLERAKIEQRIRDQMLQFGNGIEVRVTIEECNDVARPSIPTTAPTAHSADAQTPIANQPATIDAANTATDSGTENVSTIASNRKQQSINVRIRIPEQSVRDFARLQLADSQAEQTLENQFQLIQAQITAAVHPLLAVDWIQGKRQQIDVSMIQRLPTRVDKNAGSTPSTVSVLMTYFPAAGLALGVLAFLVFATAWKLAFRRERQVNERPTLAARSNRQSLPNRPAPDSISDETRRKLKQLVDDDPDQAAEIIKQWIRGAA